MALKRLSSTRIAALLLTAALVVWTFAPALDFAFLNWDDDAVIVRNAALDGSDVVRWAFTTTYMEHYQPVSWLVWAAVKRTSGASPAAFHSANLVAHVVCALLVFVVTAALLRRVATAMTGLPIDLTALAAALLYALHPLRVEVVAWISALPYTLALAFALLAVLAWLRTMGPRASRWWIAALILYVVSLAARPVALGLPLVLIVLDIGVLKRPRALEAQRRKEASYWPALRASLRRVWPFAAVAAAAAIAEGMARAPAMSDVPWLYRLQAAALAPLVYIWHTVWPLQLTPLDLLPGNPTADPSAVVTAVLALSAIAAGVWWGRRRWPWLAAVAVAYVALLAPAVGLIPSGLQATADRYTYLPGVVVAMAIAAAGAAWTQRDARRTRIAIVAAGLLVVASALLSRETLRPWSDSIALWSRVIALNPAHDIGLYNLGTALAAAGRPDEAAARYREVLALQPDHTPARANLDRLDAVRFESEGNAAASRGDLKAAAASYRQAVSLDRQRTHAQAGLGMALASLGQTADAIPALREAVGQGVDDPAVSNALAGLLAESGQVLEARSVLEAALSRHGKDINLAHNLARLLATESRFAPADAPLALRLASAVVDATAGRDPRALDTLAAALAINGRTADAAETSDRAARLAAAQGDRDLAVQITARGRSYRGR